MSSVDAANDAANANKEKEKQEEERRKQKQAKGRMYGIVAGLMFAAFVIAVLAFIGYMIYRSVQGFKGTTTTRGSSGKGGSADIKISDGAIIGTVIGVVCLIGLAAGGGIWYRRRSKSKPADQQSIADQNTTSSPSPA